MNEISLLAIALFFSLHQVSVKKGTIGCDTTTGTFISIATTAVLFTLLSIPRLIRFASFVHPHFQSFVAIMAIAGILHFLIARTAFYFCIDRVGANVAGLLAATRIMFAALFGVIMFVEKLTFQILAMSGLIFMGIAVLSESWYGNGGMNSRNAGSKVDVVGIALGLFTGFVAALSSAIVKAGMTIYSDAVLGTAIGYLASLLLFSLFAGGKIKRAGRDYWPFVLGGIFVGFGHYLRYEALSIYPVSVVEPFLSVYPMFTVVLSYVFLRDVEVFSLRLVVAALLIISGIEIYFLL